jgi:hypothetical protein
MDNLKKLKQKVRDYSSYKKGKKMFEKERDDYFKEQDKIFEEENFKKFKEDVYGLEVKKGGSIKVKKAVFGSLIKNMLSGKGTAEPDSSAPYRQTFNVKDSQTGETKNIMQDFKPVQSQSTNQNNFSDGLLGRLFGNIIGGAKQNSTVGPLKHDFYVKDKTGQNVNIAEKKNGGLIRQGYPKIAKKGWK